MMRRLFSVLFLSCASMMWSATTDDVPSTLETFTVTAQKRTQSIDDVPVPLVAYTGSFLERADVRDLQALAPLVPGMFVQEQSPNNPAINLRGITSDSADPRQAPRISLFQDGVSISRSRASAVEIFDLERVEVLKGPQGTLFGRGAEIGAISFVQNKARDETSGSLTIGIGDHGERRASGFHNAPLLPGTVFARVAFSFRRHDGLVANLADGSDLNGRDTLAVRAAVRWVPSERTTADLIVNWQRDRPPGTAFKSGVIPTTRGEVDPFTPPELNRARRLYVDRTVGGVTALLEHAPSTTWSLTSITGWREYDAFEQFDADGARIFLLEFAEDARGRQFSQEVRLNYTPGGRFAGFAGASWFRERGATRVPFYTDERQLWPFISSSFRSGLVSAGLPAALAGAAVPEVPPFAPQATLPAGFAAFNHPSLPPSVRALSTLAGRSLQPYRVDEYTQFAATDAFDVFADGTWSPVPRWELTAGLRLTREQIDSGYEVHNGSPLSTLAFALHGIPGYPYLPTQGRREAADAATSWDARLVARYEFNDTWSGYASLSRGRRPESVVVDSATVTHAREETVWNREVGVKGASPNRRLQWQAAAYLYQYAHFQTNVLSLGRFTTVDAGNAVGRGFEFAAQGAWTDWLSAFASYAYTHATFDETDDTGQPQQYAGYTFRLTPRHSWSVGATVTHRLRNRSRLTLTPRLEYRSGHFFEDNNAAFGFGLRQSGYTLVHLGAGWEARSGTWGFTAQLANALDRRYLADAGNIGGSFGIPTFVRGHPRRFTFQVTRRW